MTIITTLADKDCMFSGIVAAQETFSFANSWWFKSNSGIKKPLFDIEIVTLDGKPVGAKRGFIIQPDKAIHQVQHTDVILIPGFIAKIGWQPIEMKEILTWIRTHYERGSIIAAMCTGTFVLAQTGLLDGKIATTNWQYVRIFQQWFPSVKLDPKEILTEEDNLICAGSTSAAYNLFYHLIKRFGSEELAVKCSKTLMMDPNRKSQAPYMVFDFYKKHGDENILKAQEWMEKHFNSILTIKEAADKACVSPRQFERRFREATGESPLSYLQRLRIEIAKDKLETTNDTIYEITCQIGYENSDSFRRMFKKHTSLTPYEYRNKFSRLCLG